MFLFWDDLFMFNHCIIYNYVSRILPGSLCRAYSLLPDVSLTLKVNLAGQCGDIVSKSVWRSFSGISRVVDINPFMVSFRNNLKTCLFKIAFPP